MGKILLYFTLGLALTSCAPMGALPDVGMTASQIATGGGATPTPGAPSTPTPTPTPTPGATPTPGTPTSPGTSATPPPGGAVATGAVRTVGPGKQYSTIASAIAAAVAGDTIEIDAGTYTNDFPGTINKSLILKGVGGRPKLMTTQHAPNRKGLLVVAANITLLNLEITGVTVAEGDGANGSAIRYEGGSLLIYDCYIHHNQNGIMGAPGSGDVTIYKSEFALNGVTDAATYPSGFGYTHNIYVNANKLSILESYIFSANVGHNVKSRSANTIIRKSVIADGANGTGSYSIDLPNGGNLTVENNLIQKGPRAGNKPFVAFAMEGLTKTSNSISLVGNTVIDDLGAAVVMINNTSVFASITGNRFYNMTSADFGSGPISQSSNTFQNGAPFVASYWTTTVPSPWPAP